MKKHLFSVTLFAAAFFLLCLSACKDGEDRPDNSGTASAPLSTASSSPGAAAPPARTGEIFAEGGSIFYVDPSTGLLMRFSAAEGTAEAVYGGPVWREFLLAGGRLFFRDLESGRICTSAPDGSGLEQLLELPMTSGVMLGETLFFIDETGYGTDAVVYRYNLAREEWTARALEGGKTTPLRDTLLFYGKFVIYIKEYAEYDEIVKTSLEDWQEEVLYTSCCEADRIYEITESNGSLLFAGADMSGEKCVRSVSIKSGVQEQYAVRAGRLLSVSSEGFLFTDSNLERNTVYFGNRYGETAGYHRGIVAGVAGPFAFVASADYLGRSGLYILEPPGTEESLFLQGRLESFSSGGGYALIMLEDSGKLLLIGLESDAFYTIESAPPRRAAVSLAEYVKNPRAPALPDAEELKDATAFRAAEVFAAAVCANDRKTLSMFQGKDSAAEEYYPFYAKSCRITRFEIFDDGVAYTFEFGLYTEKDREFERYLPAGLFKSGVIRMVKSEDGWRALGMG